MPQEVSALTRVVVTIGLLAVAVTAVTSIDGAPLTSGFWLRVLFVTWWLAAAVLVARRGEPGVTTVVTVVFLISFPVAFSGLSAGHDVLDQVWRAVGSVSVVAFLYLFPRGLFEPRWTAVGCAASVAYLAARAFVPELATSPSDLVVFPLIVIVPLALQVVRYRTASNPLDRRRLQLVALAAGIALVGQLLLFGLLTTGWLGPAPQAELVVEPAAHGLAMVLPAGVVLAMVPLAPRTRRWVERVTHSHDDAAELITRLNTLAQASVSGRELIPMASEAIRRSLRLSSVSIELDEASDVQADDESGLARTWPLTSYGQRIGCLRVATRSGGRLSASDCQLLQQLSIQLAPMVSAVRLADQLEEVRTQLLNTHEEERRRLRSDLHDELGATLAGLTLKTGLARSLIDRNPDAARSILAEIEANLQTAVGRVRQLVNGLRPAHLDELGLDAAIREQAERFRAEGSLMELRIRGHADPGLPAAVELAAYRIAQEAMTNAMRHSGGTLVEVDLAVDLFERRLMVRIEDDGVGLRDAAGLGFGIQSMRQRAREVGGECTVGTVDSGGVLVVARLPLPERSIQ